MSFLDDENRKALSRLEQHYSSPPEQEDPTEELFNWLDEQEDLTPYMALKVLQAFLHFREVTKPLWPNLNSPMAYDKDHQDIVNAASDLFDAYMEAYCDEFAPGE